MTVLELDLRVASETAKSITLAWDKPDVQVESYMFCSEQMAMPSFTRDKERTSVKFAKGSAFYWVMALVPGAYGEYRP